MERHSDTGACITVEIVRGLPKRTSEGTLKRSNFFNWPTRSSTRTVYIGSGSTWKTAEVYDIFKETCLSEARIGPRINAWHCLTFLPYILMQLSSSDKRLMDDKTYYACTHPIANDHWMPTVLEVDGLALQVWKQTWLPGVLEKPQ